MFRVTGAAFRLPEPALLPPAEAQGPERLVGFGDVAIDELLPGGGLPPGALTELRASGPAAGATTLALRACRVAQSRQREQRCVFIDPSGSLFGPALTRLGIELERLIVVRPRWSDLEGVAALVANAHVASLLVLDVQDSPAPASRPANDAGLIARLALAVEGSPTSVLLVTRNARFDEPPAPGVSLRLTTTRVSEQALRVTAQSRLSRRSATRVVPWARLAELDEPGVPGAAAGA